MSTKPTGLIDLHCDTLTSFPGRRAYEQRLKRCPDDGEAFDALLERMRTAGSLEDLANTLALSRMPKPFRWAQFFAVFIPDWVRGEKAWRYFEAGCASFERQMEIFRESIAPCCDFTDTVSAFTVSKYAAFLTVEGGAVLAGELGRVKALAGRGVAALTLVWNGENELGSGQEHPEIGLTPFGRLAVAELERCGILIDVSHLNDRGFFDLCEIAERPFIATHSNARAIAPHRRNLTDRQIEELVRRKGLIGLNFYPPFLREDGNVKSLDDVYRHAVYFLEHGARHCLALGSDYDGADMPECLDSCEKSLTIYDYFLSRGLDEAVADDIMYRNAYRFLMQNLKEKQRLG